MSALDRAFRRTREGDHAGFTDWVRRIELPLRVSLRSFAHRVDVEAIVQEALLRMWVLARTLTLEGEDASLRYALRLARNLALREMERGKIFTPMNPGTEPRSEPQVDPEPPSDPSLRRAILECLERIPRQARAALQARLDSGGADSDRALAARLRMTLNTYLQNIVRARKHFARCLESKGISP